MQRLLAIVLLVFLLLVVLSYGREEGAQATRQVGSSGSAQSVVKAVGSYDVVGQPTISADRINSILAAYHSPAAGKGQALYDLGVQYSIDPIMALAFFMHESSFGTQGEARQSLSLGNLRCIPDAACIDSYAWFPSWEAGFEAWYRLIRKLYVDTWGLRTFDQIIPKYAPAADHNDEAAYIGALKHAVDVWRAGGVLV